MAEKFSSEAKAVEIPTLVFSGGIRDFGTWSKAVAGWVLLAVALKLRIAGILLFFSGCYCLIVMTTMKTLDIVLHPHPALRWKCREVTKIDAELRDIVRQMFDLMYAARGVGLAANQVGLPYRLFVINAEGDPDQKDQEMVFLNPRITRKKGSEDDEEGCLSLPEIHATVTRASQIVVDAFDLSGQQFELVMEDFPARVVQHEYDHIEGAMFTDRIAPAVFSKLQPMLTDLEVQFKARQKEGLIGSDEQLKAELIALEKLRT